VRRALGAVLLVAAALPAAAGPSVPQPRVLLQGLDKVTARVAPIEAEVGAVTRFGTLAIRPQACFATPPTEPPDSAAFLEVRELEAGGGERVVFSGWMLASSPGLSALEHPVYDVWVLACAAATAPRETPSTTQSPNG
jgi:hypothetical protein